MAGVKAGSAAAFGVLFERYHDRAYRIARSVCGDDGYAQEAVQEAFTAIWRTRASYEDRRTVAPWVLAVARNRAIDIARRNRLHALHRASEHHLGTVAGAGIIDEQVVANERANHLLNVLAQLPEAQREVIALAFYGQLTHSEIATRLELPLGTVKGRIRLALDRMRGDVPQVPG